LEKNYEIPMNFHCIIYQEALCCKVLAWKEVMSVAISSVNFIRKHGLSHRQFQQFLNESEYGDVIYIIEVKWLSRGAALKRFFYLRLEIEMFMNKNNKIVTELSNESWILDLAFLTDMITFLNELNIKLKENCCQILLLSYQPLSFILPLLPFYYYHLYYIGIKYIHLHCL